MSTATITIVGLGPGEWSDLTVQARELLAQAAGEQQTINFRTIIHPIVEPLKRTFPDVRIASFDHLYDESSEWETLYQRIAEEVCTLAGERAVIYAVPGHPLVGEVSVQLVLQMARERGISTRIVAGLSFIEPVCAALELDPLAAGMQVTDATSLAALAEDEIAGKIIPTVPLLVAQLYNRRLASAVKLALSECYPDEWPVKLVRIAGGDARAAVVEMPLYELDRNTLTDHLSALYVPPVDELSALRLPETLRYIIMRLRRDPDGCPWDRKQTHQSLMRYVLEEAYEVAEALEENDMEALADELGDLLLQVYLHAEIARQEGDFSVSDVYEHINAKLIRRHPHVFGAVQVSGAEQVVQNWQEIKRQEREAAGKPERVESIFDGSPRAAPALVISQEYQKRAINAGFNYASFQGVLDKLTEEIAELQEAVTPEQQREEMGDVLFVVALAAREMHIDAEDALRHANHKFQHRFRAMEASAREQGRPLSSYSRQEWDELWKQAKAASTLTHSPGSS
ncbi:MAG: nucleoside triphosphate pyrophosphohydrolase [Ktedonobacteraceae bacterium]